MNRIRQVRLLGMGLCLALMATLAGGGTAALSAQTAEGVVITNTATATYTDANGNTYTAASGAVSVTVGFQGSLSRGGPCSRPDLFGDIVYSILVLLELRYLLQGFVSRNLMLSYVGNLCKGIPCGCLCLR